MTLRITPKVQGEQVDLDEITRMVGCETDELKFRGWRLRAPASEDADLDGQVDWLLARLTGDTVIWKKLTERYRVDIFCGLFLERRNRGVTLAPKTMAALGARGIEIGFDIYGPEASDATESGSPDVS